MIVFLQIPFGAGMGAYETLRAALGAEHVGWVGRNVSIDALRKGLPGRQYKVLGGAITMAHLEALEGISLFTVVTSDPVARTLGQWVSVEQNSEHPQHVVSQTLFLREVLELNHPFTGLLTNALTRFLTPSRKPPTVGFATSVLSEYPFLVGDAANPEPYAEALATELGLAPDALDADAFRARNRGQPNEEMRKLLEKANLEDIRVIKEIARRRGDQPVLRT
ncbi:hypothetical protein [Acuticoccus mangrovi]|uniref:Uncharacterized protein n=1 Tax=Acuticoccus mangrovi TaxID=2796142 RepID=A0A934IT60_9HYPH|nr:hypothetical protein [Acuticoccus mangrovi]MBJ3777555.1 hypothetical protein [Acuticoccus mangrovi]